MPGPHPGYAGSYVPPAPPATGPPPQAPAGPARWSTVSIVGFVVSLLPLPFWAFSVATESVDVSLGVTLVAGIAATALGAVGLHDTGRPDVQGRGLAIAALVIGLVELVGVVVVFVIVVLVVAAFLAACASCGAAVPAVAGVHASARDPAWRGYAWSHHPHCGTFAHDVWAIGGARVCVGCTSTLATFAVGLTAASFVAWPAWWVPVAAGIPLAGVQVASLAGRTRARWGKVVVKACLGAGTAWIVWGVLAAPWPAWASTLAVAALAAAGLALGMVRGRRMAGACRAAGHGVTRPRPPRRGDGVPGAPARPRTA